MTTTLQDKPKTTLDRVKREEHENHVFERHMFGCTAAEIDDTLASKSPRDIVMYAMSTLSDAQELIQRGPAETGSEWYVPLNRDANTIRQLMNIAKYAIDKAVPR